MSEARSFINPTSQNYETLKSNTPMNANQRIKFDVLNAHIVNTVVFSGELVIVGDPSTPSCTSHEAFLMAKAISIHHDIEFNGGGVDGFLLDNFEMLQSLLAHASMGAGVATDGWAKHLEAIKRTLEQIEQLHREYMNSGTLRARDEFYAKRTALFVQLDEQLGALAAYGSGLRKHGAIKRMLNISTKSYLRTGEISRYAENITGVARAANLIKRGLYVGLALDVTATGLSIHKACTTGREEDCRRAKYVETSTLVGETTFGGLGGAAGGYAASAACVAILGIPTGGSGAIACGVAGGVLGGEIGGMGGERVGEILYEVVP
ncbi:hypothetical protein [Pseudomonas sp. Teo4]|uniref:hypothetical protein n=1 Tax=Pseudomonas sp. Teo4 TaxID=3064528 RepID=UPI002ABB13EE|nr:hypothetical protein [Pseudomonas sp. Teo4]MDZ3994004.1 hypothetical protein [Pseudomonas sp. Teo4]